MSKSEASSIHHTSFVFLFWRAEAKPEKFNSRFRNKMFYAGVSVLMDNCTWNGLRAMQHLACFNDLMSEVTWM